MASVIAAGTSYATHSTPMIPVYVFYSMFGFQRTGDQMWALGDQMGRGFLLGATAGRTTLNGEGLQHQDGHSLLLAASNPACVAYDPAFAYELRHIVREALDRMYGERDELGLLLPDPLQRAVPAAGRAGGARRRRAAARALPLPPASAREGERRAERGRRRSACWPAARPCWPPSGPRSCWPRLGRRRRPVVGHLVERAAPRRHRLRAAQPAPPGRAGAGAVRDAGAARRRSRGRVSDFQRAVPDLISRWVPGRLDARSAPTATGAPTPGPRCAAGSGSTHRRSPSRRWSSWPSAGRSRRRPSRRPSTATRSTATGGPDSAVEADAAPVSG